MKSNSDKIEKMFADLKKRVRARMSEISDTALEAYKDGKTVVISDGQSIEVFDPNKDGDKS